MPLGCSSCGTKLEGRGLNLLKSEGLVQKMKSLYYYYTVTVVIPSKNRGPISPENRPRSRVLRETELNLWRNSDLKWRFEMGDGRCWKRQVFRDCQWKGHPHGRCQRDSRNLLMNRGQLPDSLSNLQPSTRFSPLSFVLIKSPWFFILFFLRFVGLWLGSRVVDLTTSFGCVSRWGMAVKDSFGYGSGYVKC